MAESKQMQQERRRGFFECAVCFSHIIGNKPRALPCLHTFCESCLVKCSKNDPPGSVKCPTCGKLQKLPQGGIQNLPHNFLLIKFADIVSKERSCCHWCLERLENPPYATIFCDECGVKFCEDCKSDHEAIPGFRGHKCTTLSQRNVEDGIDICRAHGQTMTLYCFDCKQCICVSCAMGAKHASHRDQVLDLQKAMETRYKTTTEDKRKLNLECSSLSEKLKRFKEKLEDIDASIYAEGEKKKRQIEHCFVELKQELTINYIEPTNKRITDLKEIDEKLQSSKIELGSSIQTAYELERLESLCAESRKKLEVVMEGETSAPKFVVSSATPSLGTLQTSIDTFASDDEDPDYTEMAPATTSPMSQGCVFPSHADGFSLYRSSGSLFSRSHFTPARPEDGKEDRNITMRGSAHQLFQPVLGAARSNITRYPINVANNPQSSVKEENNRRIQPRMQNHEPELMGENTRFIVKPLKIPPLIDPYEPPKCSFMQTLPNFS